MANNINSAESLGDIVTSMEAGDEFWYNALDDYQNYTYNIELFIVPFDDAAEYLENEESNIDLVISNGGPTEDIKYITIAETGTTTEFNIQDLQIESLGAGAASTSLLAGTAVSLNFSIIQVGNTSLGDSLINASMLSGYPSISEAKFFVKLNFKGYSDDGVALTSESKNLTKLFPIIIRNIGDVNTTTDARGTVTSIEATIAPNHSTSKEINLIQHNFEYEIGNTLQETLESFQKELNGVIQRNDFSTDNSENNPFINQYEIVMDEQFEIEFAQSKMNDDNIANTGSANNEVSTRSGSTNSSVQTGVVTPFMSVIDVIYDICIQSVDIKNHLTENSDTTTNVVSVVPTVSPKQNGFSVLTGQQGNNVKYYISMKRQIVVQNNSDAVIKISKSAQLVKEIFEKNQCKKIYYNRYTGLNDQVLDLQVSLNRQLIKANNLVSDNTYAKRFWDTQRDLIQDLNPRAQAEIRRIEAESNRLTNDFEDGAREMASLRNQLEEQQRVLANDTVDSLVSSGALPPGARQDMMDTSLADVMKIAEQHDPELLAELKSQLSALEETTKIAERQALQNDIQNRLKSLSEDENSVLEQSISAELSQINSNGLDNLSGQFQEQLEDSSRILLEEISSDLITQLTEQNVLDIIDVMTLNPVVFRKAVLPALSDNRIQTFVSSDEERVALAREKFYESVQGDVSMHKATMTIKGDPYWIDTYLTPKMAKNIFDDKNALDEYKSHPTAINGANYIIIIENKSAGVDEFDNTKIANLVTMLYMVKSISSSFTNGLFTQTLDLVKVIVPDSFTAVNPIAENSNINETDG